MVVYLLNKKRKSLKAMSKQKSKLFEELDISSEDDEDQKIFDAMMDKIKLQSEKANNEEHDKEHHNKDDNGRIQYQNQFFNIRVKDITVMCFSNGNQ